MIELNLIPDVKQELIRAQRSRALVVSLSILISVAAGVVVVLLAGFVFVGQTVIINGQKQDIASKDKDLHAVAGLAKTLTIQNQLSQIATLHNEKGITSNLQYILTKINPAEPNNAKFSRISLDTEQGTIKIEAQADGGFKAFDIFKKTLKATKVSYPADAKKPTKVDLIKDGVINESDVSSGNDDTGKTVLRFTISFSYAPELLARESGKVQVEGPVRTDATDSFQGLPQSIFDVRAKDQENN